VWTTGSYDPETNLVLFGTGEPQPWGDPEFRPGDNLFTNSVIALDVETGKLKWHFQEIANESWDYDTVNPRLFYDIQIDGQMRKAQGNFSRNGFFYTLDRQTGEFLFAKAYTKQNWTAGLDPKTGKPVEYNPTVKLQTYANNASLRAGDPKTGQGVCPMFYGSPTYFPPTYDARRNRAWVIASDGCFSQVSKSVVRDGTMRGKNIGSSSTYTVDRAQQGRIIGVDVRTGEKVQEVYTQHALYGGLLGTAGDLIFTGHPDGRFVAYDKDTLSELWSFNTGTVITAPPMTYSVGGKQYVAIVVGGQKAIEQVFDAPELKLLRENAQVVVFGL
jgi:alcohol dehydrogenase (cytochrome c)